MRQMKNYGSFLLNYIGFRDGVGIKTSEGVDTASVAVVFLKKDYGTIEDDSTVIDIGANIGVFSVFAAATSANTKVYAYEPAPESFGLLLKNVDMNKLECSVIPFKLGVAACKGKRKLFMARGSLFHSMYPAGKRNFVEVDCISLKDVFDGNGIERCDILKIDCEGAEFEILYGTPDEYLSRIREIRMEYHNMGKEGCDIESLTRFLGDRGLRRVHFRKSSGCSGNAWFRRA